jgi:HEAT repeat protein
MVFGLFSKDKTKALQKTIERATNKLSQQPDRWSALEKLKEDGSEDALYGLCKRWSITAMKGVEDEQEKTWVVDVLVGVGGAALPALKRYLASATEIAFALKVLEGIGDPARALEVVDATLAVEKPGYTRHPERRIDLIRWLSEWKALTSDQVVPRLVPYAGDFDENVRYAVVDGLAHHDVALTASPLLEALLRAEEESGRIKRRIGEILAEHKVALGDREAAVKGILVGTLANFSIKGGVLQAR